MRQHPVYQKTLQIGENVVSGDEAKHPAMLVRAFDGLGNQADAEVVNVQKNRLTIKVKQIYLATNEAGIEIKLAQAILKADKLAEVVRKATELGVREICFFSSHYSDLNKLSENKLIRLKRIALEAAKQSGRAFVPKLKSYAKLTDIKPNSFSLVAHPYRAKHLASFDLADKVTIFIGPEGGFAESEIESLIRQGSKAVNLGPRILRAETAGPALISAILIPNAI